MRLFSIGTVFAVSMLLLAGTPAQAQFTSASDLDVKTVTLLHWSEANTAHAFNAGALFVGKSKQSDAESHRVEVYIANGTRLLGTVALPHSPSFAYPLGSDSVLITGKSFTDQFRTHYTIITRRGNSLTSRTTTLPTEYQIEQFGGNEQARFFNETGNAAIIAQQGAGFRQLRPSISGPGHMQFVGNYLFVVERHNPGMGDENIVRVDLRNETADRTFKDYLRQGITETRHLPGTNVLVANETLAGHLLFIDENANTLISQIDVPRDVRALETLGHCLLASAAEGQSLSFIDTRDTNNPRLVDQWDLSGVGQTLRRPNGLAVDASAGVIYVRSTWTCPTCNPQTQSSVVAVTQKSRATIDQCLAP